MPRTKIPEYHWTDVETPFVDEFQTFGTAGGIVFGSIHIKADGTFAYYGDREIGRYHTADGARKAVRDMRMANLGYVMLKDQWVKPGTTSK